MTDKLHELVVIVKNAEGVPVVTSLEVAEKFKKQHNHVLRDIDNLLEDATRERSNFGQLSYVAKNKAKHRCFEMNERGFSLLAMGFTGREAMKWKSAFLDAFEMMRQELTRRHEPVNLSDPTTLRGLLLDYSEKVIALTSQVEAMQPDVDAINHMRATPGSLPLRHAAKELKMSPMKFCDWLEDMHWTHWHNGERRIAYQQIIDKGWLSHGPAAIVDRSDGRRERVTAVHVTTEGMIELTRRLKANEAE